MIKRFDVALICFWLAVACFVGNGCNALSEEYHKGRAILNKYHQELREKGLNGCGRSSSMLDYLQVTKLDLILKRLDEIEKKIDK